MYLGKRIKELRIKKGLTQLELANSLFLDDRTISKWEQEKGNPNIDIIPSLAKILGVSIDYLFNGKEYIPTQDHIIEEAIKYFESLIEQEITNDYIKRLIARQIEGHDLESIKDALDACFEAYLSKLNKPYGMDNIREAASKIGGIIHNQSLSPLDKKVKHLISSLSKNTIKPTTSIKNYCETLVRSFLISFDSINTNEQKITLLDEMHKIFINKHHYDLYHAIRYFEKTIQKENNKRELKSKIDNGYLQLTDNSIDKITHSIQSINEFIRKNDLINLPKAILNCLDITFRFLACDIDKSLIESQVPYISIYYKDLYNIFGKFLGKENYKTISCLIEKYSKGNINKIDFSDLLSLKQFLDQMIFKLSRYNKLALNNFNYDYFKKGVAISPMKK